VIFHNIILLGILDTYDSVVDAVLSTKGAPFDAFISETYGVGWGDDESGLLGVEGAGIGKGAPELTGVACSAVFGIYLQVCFL
jgi:hypothetical protein